MLPATFRSSLKWLAIVGLLAGGFYLGMATAPRRSAPPPLPPNTVTVEVVKEIPVPGPVKVVERVRWRTETVEVPKEIIKDVVAQAEASGLPVEGKVEVLAEKYEGTLDGEVRFGWKGTADCKIRPQGGEWTTIVSEPFDLSESTAETTIAPDTALPLLNRISIMGGVTPDGFAYSAGYWRHLSWRSRIGRRVLPESFGTQIVITPNDTAVLGGFAWSF